MKTIHSFKISVKYRDINIITITHPLILKTVELSTSYEYGLSDQRSTLIKII